jgi:hypothetical protein
MLTGALQHKFQTFECHLENMKLDMLARTIASALGAC